jgi:hypothetical protein
MVTFRFVPNNSVQRGGAAGRAKNNGRFRANRAGVEAHLLYHREHPFPEFVGSTECRPTGSSG